MANARSITLTQGVYNPNGFDKAVYLKSDSGSWLLLPRCLLPTGCEFGTDPLEQREIFFYPTEDYALVCNHSTKVVPKGRMTGVRAGAHLRRVRNALYWLSCNFDVGFSPHDLTEDYSISHGRIGNGGVLVSEKVKALLDRREPITGSFWKEWAELGRIAFHPLVEIYRGKKVLNKALDLDFILDVTNRFLFSRHRDHAAKILGMLVQRFTDEVSDKIGKLNTNTIGSNEVAAALSDVQTKLGNVEFSKAVTEFLFQYEGKLGSPVIRALNPKRRWSDYTGEQLYPLTKWGAAAFPAEIQTGELLEMQSEYLSQRQVTRFRAFAQNMLFHGLGTPAADQVFQDWTREWRQAVQIRMGNREYDRYLLTYYLDAFRPMSLSDRYMKTYNVLENFMGGRSRERAMLEKILKEKVDFSDTKLIAEVTKINGLRPVQKYFSTTISASHTDLAQRLYEIRCAITHSKRKEAKILPYSQEEFDLVGGHMRLIQIIARMSIEKTTRMKLFHP